MKALVYHGTEDVRIDTVDDPVIKDPKDIILKITSTAICGSDLHLYNNLVPTVKKGDILGHEFMGEVVELGSEVKNLKKGDRVLIPFTIACGNCAFCNSQKYSLCDNSNAGNKLAEEVLGYPTSGFFGYTDLFGGYQGGQAEYVRVPYADVGALKIPDHLPDEKVLFITDIFPTGYMAAENADIKEGDTVAIWGAGPVGQFAIRSAFMLGAKRVIVIDRFPERLKMAEAAGAETINYEEQKEVFDILKQKTHGKGPDSCIDAVGMEAHGAGGINAVMNVIDKAKQAVMLESDRPIVLRQMIHAAKKGSTLSIPGVYSGFIDKMPMGVAFNKGLTFKMGQTHVQKYTRMLLEKVEKGEIDPSFVITHNVPLDKAPDMYKIFRDKEDKCVKVVLKP